MSRRYPERPMVGVSAVVFREDRVLLVQRGRSPAIGQWSIPGGLVKVGESLDEAIRREVREEVGLHVAVLDMVAVLDRILCDDNNDIEYHYILIDFLCSASDEEPNPGDDVVACKFLPLDELSSYQLTRGTQQVILNAHQRSLGQHPPIYDPQL